MYEVDTHKRDQNEPSVNLLASYVPRCSIGRCPPSASFQQNASQDRPGTLWVCRRCSVASQRCQEGTGRTAGGQRLQGRGTGTSAVCPAAERPRRKMLWKAAKKRKKCVEYRVHSSDNISKETHLVHTAPLWNNVQILLHFAALANPKLPVRKGWKKGQSCKVSLLYRETFRECEERDLCPFRGCGSLHRGNNSTFNLCTFLGRNIVSVLP